MRYDDHSQEEQAPAVIEHCKAEGCTNPVTFNGLCYFHSEAKNAKAWPEMTRIMQSKEFKYLANYWREMMKWHYPTIIRLPENNRLFRPDELIRNFQIRLVRFGIDPALVEFKETDFLKNYAIRMRELVLNKVLEDTGALVDEGGLENKVTTMPSWVPQRIQDVVKSLETRKAIRFEPEAEAA